MNTNISIEKIEVSITGISDNIAKRSFVQFDKELSLQASKFLNGGYNLAHHLNSIDGGSLHVHRDIQPAQLRRLVAERVLKSMVQESL